MTFHILPIFVGLALTQWKNDLDALQGTWFLKAVEYQEEEIEQNHTLSDLDLRLLYYSDLPEKREIPPDRKKWRKTITFKGNEFVRKELFYRFNSHIPEEGIYDGIFSLDVTRNPKVMTRKYIDSNLGPYRGIYRIQGDFLYLCTVGEGSGKEVPNTFKTDPEGKLVLRIFQREKPEKRPCGERR